MIDKPYALITGASSGIGYQYARVMADRGYNLLIVSNEADAIVEKGEILKHDFGVEVVALMRDLRASRCCRDDTLQFEAVGGEGWIDGRVYNHAGEIGQEGGSCDVPQTRPHHTWFPEPRASSFDSNAAYLRTSSREEMAYLLI